MNVVAIGGRLSRPAEEQVLASGTRIVKYDVTVPGPDGKGETVPVVWFDAPASGSGLDEGTEVVATGRVRRRFFQLSGGGVGSRTEVVATSVVRRGRTKAVRDALARAVLLLEEADDV